MIIRDILQNKGRRVETIWPERTVGDVVARFEARNISSIVVTDHRNTPIGIVTDRDVLRALARDGQSVLEAPATEVMQEPVPFCSEDDTVNEIMRRMTFDRIRHVVVMDGRNVAGIVSIGDLLKSTLRDADLECRVLRERALSRLAAE